MKDILGKFDISKEEDRDAAIFGARFDMFEKKGGAKRGSAFKKVDDKYFEELEKQ